MEYPNLQIKIDCKGSNSIPLNKLQYFQGNLKELSEKNYLKLRTSIEKYGFKFPIFVWKNNILDGHQRVFTLGKMVKDGWHVDNIPVVEIQAETEQEAKKLLLLINSRYGQMTTDGLYEYLETNKIDLDFLKMELDLSGKGLNLKSFEEEFYTEPREDDDEIPVIQRTNIKNGDVFQLGEHKLLCGNSDWNVKRDNTNQYIHPTQKPVELIQIPLFNSSKQNDIVMDFFGGSGSTLVACEKTKRKCRMIEIDPFYCQVIIDRWEKYTNKKATKILQN